MLFNYVLTLNAYWNRDFWWLVIAEIVGLDKITNWKGQGWNKSKASEAYLGICTWTYFQVEKGKHYNAMGALS